MPETLGFDERVARSMFAGLRAHGPATEQSIASLRESFPQCSALARRHIVIELSIQIARAEALDVPLGGLSSTHRAWRRLRDDLRREV